MLYKQENGKWEGRISAAVFADVRCLSCNATTLCRHEILSSKCERGQNVSSSKTLSTPGAPLKLGCIKVQILLYTQKCLTFKLRAVPKKSLDFHYVDLELSQRLTLKIPMCFHVFW